MDIKQITERYSKLFCNQEYEIIINRLNLDTSVYSLMEGWCIQSDNHTFLKWLKTEKTIESLRKEWSKDTTQDPISLIEKSYHLFCYQEKEKKEKCSSNSAMYNI